MTVRTKFRNWRARRSEPLDRGFRASVLRHKFLIVLALAGATFAGISSGYRIRTEPVALESKAIDYGFATVQMLLDSRVSTVGNSKRNLSPIGERAEVYASLFTSDQVRERVADDLKIRPSAIVLTTIQAALSASDNTDAQQELSAAVAGLARYKVTFKAERRGPQGSVALPLITVSAQAPTRAEAERLVLATTAASTALVRSRAPRESVKKDIAPLQVTRIGPVRGVTVHPGTAKVVSVGVGVAALGLLLVLIAAVDALWLSLRAGRRRLSEPSSDGGDA